jgi:hypothetical protein
MDVTMILKLKEHYLNGAIGFPQVSLQLVCLGLNADEAIRLINSWGEPPMNEEVDEIDDEDLDAAANFYDNIND